MKRKGLFEHAAEAEHLVDSMSGSLPVLFMILDEDRRIRFANDLTLKTIGVTSREAAYGKRPGEALGCEMACVSPEGCGHSPRCPRCGAFQAIMDALSGLTSVHECLFRSSDGNCANFRVWTRPFSHGGRSYVTFSMLDIAAEKRREALERTFFHDLMNSASGISGLVDVMSMHPENALQVSRLMKLTREGVGQMVEEIRSAKALFMAESDSLAINPKLFRASELLWRLGSRNFCGATRESFHYIGLEPGAQDFDLVSDETLILRILSNLVKNAVEADGSAAWVRVTASDSSEGGIFHIHNETVIPAELQGDLFKRSFSTKGPGRGLGTYGARLFAERFLGGRIWFTSEVGQGTTFHVKVPNLASRVEDSLSGSIREALHED